MSLEEDSTITVEEVNKALEEIENKYSPSVTRNEGKTNYFHQSLTVLSKELDSVGLPSLDLSQSLLKIFKQVVSSSRSLVQIHRTVVSQIKDINIESRGKDVKRNELCTKIDDYKAKLKKSEDRCSELERKIIKLNKDNSDLLKKEVNWKGEMDKLKRFHVSKQNELQHVIQRLTKENHKLRELFGRDIGDHKSTDDVALKLLKKYKVNEEIYKQTIQKLQDNNKELMDEILNIKEDIILSK